jgi:hypothetical protein
MDIFLAGIAHGDPTGRAKIIAWLDTISKRLDSPPAFVAVEYHSDSLGACHEQRLKFTNEMHARFPEMPKETLQELSKAIAYEIDPHMPIFPTARVVYLDENRSDAQIERTWSSMIFLLCMTIEALAENKHPISPSDVFAHIASQRSGEKSQPTPDRDRLWMSILTDVTSKTDGSWCALVVGTDHLENRKDSIRGLLQERGFKCHVTDLTPEAEEIPNDN